MNVYEKLELEQKQNYLVVKHNDLVQKTRFELSLLEQKTIAYICSLIKPAHSDGTYKLEYEFSIKDYCQLCGLTDSGKNYSDVKACLQKLSDRSFWLTKDKSDILCRWLQKVTINKRSGRAKIKIDEDLVEYLYNLGQCFTRYELWNVLAMKSAFSVRVYELMKSYAFQGHVAYDLDEFKQLLMVEGVKSYDRFPDFRRYVLETALKEINELTDLNVTYEQITRGRKVVRLQFYITAKKPLELLMAGYKTREKTTDKVVEK